METSRLSPCFIQVDGTSGYCSASGNTAVATACYVYDALGQRSVKIPSSGVWTQYFYDLSSNVVAEFGSGCGPTCWTTGYAYFNGALAAQYSSSTTHFAHSDHLGSTRLVTDVYQNVAQNLDYLPFGELNSPDTGITTHEFTGDEQDAETALAHTLFRQYSSSIGRWMTPDPAGLAAVDPSNPQSWNRYAYVLNNTLAFVDPFGLEIECYGGQTYDYIVSYVDGEYAGSDLVYIGDKCGGGGAAGGGGNTSGTPKQPTVSAKPTLKFKPPSWENFATQFLPCYGAQLLGNLVGNKGKAAVTFGTIAALKLKNPWAAGAALLVWTGLAAFNAGSACAVASRGYYQ